MQFQLSSRMESKKEIPESSSWKQFCFIRWKRQHLRTNKWRRYGRFKLFEKTISNLSKFISAKCLGSDRLFCLISISKSDSFLNLFVIITSLSKLLIRYKRIILLVQAKEVISIAMAAARVAVNHIDKWDLNWYLRWGIYRSTSIRAYSKRSVSVQMHQV